MRNTPSVLAAVQSGYRNEPNPHLHSSDHWLAHEAGIALNKKGMPPVRAACKSRGYTIRVETNSYSEMLVQFDTKTLVCTDITRINH